MDDSQFEDKNIPEKVRMLINANGKIAKDMSLETMGIVVLEGIFNLLVSIGSLVEKSMNKISNEELVEMGNTKNGEIVLSCMNEFAISMATIITSIEQLQAMHPDDYERILSAFQNKVLEDVNEQQEALVEEFMRSIPDTLPPDAV